ncbi:vWA domain-containing protein [Butyrivibrio sp. VCD2006]|uniref:vWA domain-containing protein n=1 Tax=Butyrivibrio sp. VCD2006 TaxID=1280664 RepID=UPI00040AADB3|nr:VWA domain-containing protein [Butyrivibrio sp. VCD2006]
MKRKMRVASIIMSGTILTSALTGCGGTQESAATPKYEPASDTTSTYDYYEEETACADDASCEAPLAGTTYSSKNANLTEGNNIFEGEYNTESYDKPEENGYNLVLRKPLSTFAADVDTASYSNVRRMIEDGYTLSQINPDAVRPEEFINYFNYELNNPEGNDKFGITTELSTCPWNEEHELMFVGMKTKDIDLREAPESNLVFLIDVSGSMSDDDKLPLLQKSFDHLVGSLPDKGKISIVTYSGEEKIVLSGESMENKKRIMAAIDSLEAGGCTNGEAGIQMAYKVAKKNYIEGGINRIILATDGDLNVGISNANELERFITKKKDEGIFLSVLGFGEGNLKDDNLERLADCGNGNYSYIDSLFEGKKVLVDEMGSTLVTVAKDVKLQVEFNPEKVNSYRLIGYENRIMRDQDFNDDTKDGGEIGAGHSVVALYEIVPEGSQSAIALKYQDDKTSEDKNEGSQYSSEYATVSVRYKEPDADKSQLFSIVVDENSFHENGSENIRFAGLVAEFAMLLSDSEYKGNATFTDIMDGYKQIENTDEYKDEFGQLVRLMAKRS